MPRSGYSTLHGANFILKKHLAKLLFHKKLWYIVNKFKNEDVHLINIKIVNNGKSNMSKLPIVASI